MSAAAESLLILCGTLATMVFVAALIVAIRGNR